jgi:hypothetical protein
MEDDPSVEGMEGADVVVCDVEDDDGPSDDDDDDVDDHGGGGGGEVASGSSVLDVECPPAIDVECPPPSTSGVTANTAESTGHSHVGNDVVSEHVLRARLLLYRTALKERDDVMMKHLRQRMGGEKRDKRDAASEAAMLLLKRGREQNEADAKRRKEELGAERLAANETERLKLATARTQEQLAQTRLELMRQAVINRRDQEAARRREAETKAANRWLQNGYPSEVATRLMAVWRDKPDKAKKKLDATLRLFLSEGRLRRMIILPQLWQDDHALTQPWATFQPPGGGAKRHVRCGVSFLSVIDQVVVKTHFGLDPVEQLLRLLGTCVPSARLVFTGTYSPARLFQLNDFVFEKAFIYAIIIFSKWLGPERFPQGIYGDWPAAAFASQASSSSVASSSASPAVIVDAHVPSPGPIAPLT